MNRIISPVAAAAILCLGAARGQEATPDGSGFAGAYQPSKNWQPPKDPPAIEKLRKFQDLKFGILYCWGTQTQIGTVDQSWCLCPERYDWNKRPAPYENADTLTFKKAYENLQKTFNPVNFNPEREVRFVEECGAKYLIFCTKHHDGFCFFDTQTTDYKITSTNCPYNISPNANVTRRLFEAGRRRNLWLGVYFSKPDWNTPFYWAPEFGPPTSRNCNYVPAEHPEVWAKFKDFTWAQIRELMSGYGPVDILWLDGGQVQPGNKQDIDMAGLARMSRGYQPGLLVVDRTAGGGFEDYLTPEGTHAMPERFAPDAWEACMTLGDRSWAWSRDSAYMSSATVIRYLVKAAARNGNLLLGIGPDAQGEMDAKTIKTLQEIGAWLKVNGEAIYATRPIEPYELGDVFFTRKADGAVYLLALSARDGDPMPRKLRVPAVLVPPGKIVTLVGGGGVALTVERTVDGGVEIKLPETLVAPCAAAWAFKVSGAATANPAASAPGPQVPELLESDWNGFRKKSFALDGIPASVVVPPVAAPGKPWIWRTSWSDNHREVDRELVRCGFHVAYIEVADQLGVDKALETMDRFYDHVRAKFGLAAKCAIEPTNGGGLHASRYASRHPGRIACLLGDEPVTDTKNWSLPRDMVLWQNVAPFPKAFESAQFVLRYAAVPSGAPGEYFDLRDGLANSKAKFEKEKVGRVAFVGGSITYNGGWRDELMRYFRDRFPETKFEFIASGIPSVGSLGHAFRLTEDVLSKGAPDLVFVEAAVNDHNYDACTNRADLARRGMEGVVRQIRRQFPMADVVEMHFIAFWRPEPGPYNHLAQWTEGKMPYPIAEHEKVAAYYGCPSLNLSKEVADRIAAGQFTWETDFRDVHPSPYGQRVYANSMMRMLDAAFESAAVPRPHPLPDQPLDNQSFFHGRHGKLEDAILSGGFRFEKNWSAKNGQEERAGYFNCPAVTANQSGAEMTCSFTGTAFGLFLAAGRDTGVIEFSTDGAPFRQFDTWSPNSRDLNLPWPVILESGLPPGRHTIRIRTTDHERERQALHVIHVLLN